MQMIESGHHPSAPTLLDLLDSHSRASSGEVSSEWIAFSIAVFQELIKADWELALGRLETLPLALRDTTEFLSFAVYLKARKGKVHEALSSHRIVKDRGVSVSGSSWEHLIRALLGAELFVEAMETYRSRNDGLRSLRHASLVALLASCPRNGTLEDFAYLEAECGMQGKLTLALRTTFINCCFAFGQPQKAIDHFSNLLAEEMIPDRILYEMFINAYSCGSNEDPDIALMWYESMLFAGHAPAIETLTNLMACFARAGNAGAVETCFSEIVRHDGTPDLEVYTTAMHVYARGGDVANTERWFRQLLAAELKPDTPVFCVLVNAYAKAQDFDAARRMLQEMHSIIGDAPPSTSGQDAASGKTKKKRKRVRTSSATQHVYNVLTLELVCADQMQDALWLLHHMVEAGISPDVYTTVAMIKGHMQSGNKDGALRLYSDMIRGGLEPNNHVFCALATMLGKLRAPASEVEGLVGDMIARGIEPDMKTWTALMYAFGRANARDTVLAMWDRIRQGNTDDQPDDPAKGNLETPPGTGCLDGPDGELGVSHHVPPLVEIDNHLFSQFVRTCIEEVRQAGGPETEEGWNWVRRITDEAAELLERGLVLNIRGWDLMVTEVVPHGAIEEVSRMALQVLQRLATSSTGAQAVVVPREEAGRPLVPSTQETHDTRRRTPVKVSFDHCIRSMRLAADLKLAPVPPDVALHSFCKAGVLPLVRELTRTHRSGHIATIRSLLVELRTVYPDIVTAELLRAFDGSCS
ncbi:hypothetical protein HKX48_005001 [Thoreauomyces humboldtii]|nr:hypothetical protein HKX48_005001 [Thoreauomyces humboldtii]